jgi:hypothetical protein
MTYEELMDMRTALFIEKDQLAQEYHDRRWEMIAERMAMDRAGDPAARALPASAEELGGSPNNEAWGTSSLQATRTFKVDWADRYTLGDWLITPPNDMYPYGAAGMAYLNSIGIAPFGEACFDSGDGLNSYEFAIVTAGYQTLTGEIPTVPGPSGATLIEEDISPSVELISLEGVALCWGSNSGPALEENQTPAVRLLHVAYTVTLHGIPSVSVNLINYGGYCHSLPYVSPTIGWTFPAETLLYSAPQMTRSVSLLGTPGWTVRVPWEYRPNGWNKFLNEEELKSGGTPWQDVYFKGGNKLVVATPTDLSSFLP